MLSKIIGIAAFFAFAANSAIADQSDGLSEEFCIELGWQLVSTLDLAWSKPEGSPENLEAMAHAYSLVEPYKDDELKMAQAMLCLWGASRN
ncbi:hypothetical protein [Loktanella salsilacus]|uniref:hypothetical protein n=1 Tax=Loktanella salsilacus TaxID=195913 RepID=UPI0020B7687C|nr:hypothetical protein [Loktanella salsilacus]UTH45326.1 hypothetical protein KBK07_04425 [Loktanella salsilacus]